jgi:hypothetical protein
MQELVSVEQAEKVLRWLVLGGPLLGAIVGAVIGALRSQEGCKVGCGAKRGFAVGLLGPIIYLMWRMFGYLVRYNPETGEAGLHQVSVMALSALVFVVVGALLGVFYRRVVFPDTDSDDSPATAPAGDAETHTR